MAVTPGYVTSVGITWSASATATASAASIGTATWDRLVVVGITVEETATINTVTIGGITATSGISVRNTTGTPDNACALFYARVPTGTTANIVVTLSASSSQTGRISIWAVTGAMTPHTTSNSAQGAGATQTLGGVTIPSNGAGFWVFNNATAGTAITWTNATERDDADNSGVTYRHGAADTTTAGTPTVTADGATANQILAGISFAELPPATGFKLTVPAEKAYPQPRQAALALIASGLAVWNPQPIVQRADAATADKQTRQSADITTGRRGTRTLHYQSWVRPPAPPVAAPSNLTTSIDWLRPFDRAVPPRRPAKTVLTLPAYPYADVVAAPSAGWFQPFRPVGGAAGPLPSLARAGFITAPTLVTPPENRGGTSVTTAYPSPRTGPLFYQSKIVPPPFVPPAAVVVATIEWVPPFSTMPPSRFVVRPQPPFVPPVAAQVTADEWLQPLSRAIPRPPVHTQPVMGFAAAPQVTPDQWLVRWQGPPRVAQQLAGGVVYAHVAPFVDNTTTIDKWKLDWNVAAKATRPIHTQPFYGYPYVSQPTVTTTLEWMEDWRGPPRQLLRLPGGTPFVPKEVVQDVHGPDKWLQAFRGPPRYWPVKVQQTPFIPRIAVIDNTVTPDSWLFRFQGAVPRPPVRVTQPFFGYPYESRPNLTTSIEWLQKWQGPPRYTPLRSYPYQPFVPRIAVIDNTVTPDKWLRGFDRPRPARPVARPAIAWNYTPVIVQNTVTIDKWQQPLSCAARIPRTARPTQPAGFLQPATVFFQSVNVRITMSFERVRRTVCRAQTDDGSVTQAEQGDVWVTQDEAPGDCNSAFEFVAFEEDAFQSCEVIVFEVTEQSDQWTTQAEADDPWSEQQQEPGSSCCDED